MEVGLLMAGVESRIGIWEYADRLDADNTYCLFDNSCTFAESVP